MAIWKWEPYKTTQLFNLFKRGRLVIPDYQRGLVHSTAWKQQLLIDVIAGKTIPSIVLRQRVDGSYEISDGQQRFDALKTFYDRPIGQSWASTPTETFQPFGKLSEPEQTAFEDYIIQCETVSDISDAEIRAEFKKRNGSTKILNGGEQIHAAPKSAALDFQFARLGSHPVFSRAATKRWVHYPALLLALSQYLGLPYARYDSSLIDAVVRVDDDDAQKAADELYSALDEVEKALSALEPLQTSALKDDPKQRKLYSKSINKVLIAQYVIALRGHGRFSKTGADEFAKTVFAGFDKNPNLVSVGGHGLDLNSTTASANLKLFSTAADASGVFRSKQRTATSEDRAKVRASQTVDGVVMCYQCRKPILNGDGEYDHVNEYENGGDRTPDNLRLLHKVCHRTPAYRANELQPELAATL